jgi:mRNA interferase MazF
MSSAYVPDRGDVVWLEFSPQAGHEQAGRRPALVLSPASYNGRTGLLLCCPITTREKGYPFEVAVPDTSGARGVVLSDQLKSLDWRARNAQRGGRADPSVVQEVAARLKALLP